MDLKKEVKEIIKWAQESEDNKKKVIKFTTIIINVLNNIDKELSDKDLNNIAGGSSGWEIPCDTDYCL